VKHGLAVLVQQHLALWYSSDTTTYYEADWTNAYALVRLGKLIKFIENRFDAAAGEVLSTLVLSGHAQVADLARAYTVSRNGVVPGFVAKKAAFTNGDLPNGHSKHQQNGHVPSFDAIHSALQTLLASGFLTVAHESHFRPDIDNRAIAHKQCEAYTQFQAPLKGEKRLEFAQAVDGLLHEWKFGSSVYHSKNMSTKGKKRLRDEDCEDAGGLKKKVRSETFVNGLNSTLSHNGDAVMVKIEVCFILLCFLSHLVNFR
jgi:DNA-directed RNA polymerase III subunit RPC3